MTRVEELTSRFIDGDAAADEREELRRIVDEDPDARRLMVTLLHAEGMLRGGRPADVSAAVMEQIRAPARAADPAPEIAPDKAARTGGAVSRSERRRRWWPLALTLTLGTAFAFITVWTVRRATRRGPDGNRVTTSHRAPPRLGPGSAPGLATAPEASPRGSEVTDPSGAAGTAAARARSAAAPSLAGDREPITLFSLDFEDGDPSPPLMHGRLVSDACPPGSRQCALGGLPFGRPDINAVSVERYKPPLSRYGNTRVVTFDYWIGRDEKYVTVQLWDQDRKQNYHLSLNDAVGGAWGHAQVRFVDLVPNVRKDDLMEEGDEIQNMMIKAGHIGGPPLYVDNIKILEYRLDTLPPKSTARASQP